MQLPHKKKTMSGSAKGKKGKQRNNSKKNQSTMYDGCYGNTRLAHVLLSLMGKDCQAKLRNNTVYEGLFHSFSQQMELSLNAVNRRNVDTMNGTKHQASESPKEVDLVNECVFRFDNIVSMQFPNVDLDYAVQDVNETNGEMAASQQRGMKSFEKKLEPWNGGGDSLDADSMAIGGLESSGIDGTNGWDASDMFKANEEKYGVKSDYDSSLPSYTMALNINEEKPEKIARATRLAQEIEGSSDYRQRVDLEVDDGLTEEDKFSAVVRDREFRRDGRGSRDSHDRDNDHPLFREREKSDRDREQGIPPYRNNRDYNEKFRGRGARMREFQQRTQQGYSGPMGHSRQMGPGGPPGGDRRNQMSMAQMDGSGPQAKFNRNVQQANIPPRFSKTGSGGGHSREDERMKQSDNPMHSSYQPPKHQRQPRMNNRMSGNRTWSNPSGNEYMHHNPTQMHTDSPAMVGVPQNGSGPNLSRTSSSSSNTSAPMQQGHRKQHSTSSQDDQPPHPAHIRQSSRHSSSPTGGPVAPNPQPPLPRSQVMPVSMQTSSHQDPPSSSWAAAVARGNMKQPPLPTTADMTRGHMTQQSQQGIPQTSQGDNPPIHVRPNVTYTWTPPPNNAHYSQMSGPRGPVQMMARSHNPPPGAVPGPQQQTILQRQQMPPQNIHPPPNSQALSHQVNQQQPKNQNNTPTEPGKHHAQKAEESKSLRKTSEAVQSVSATNTKSGDDIKELQEFRRNFKLSNEVNKESANSLHSQNKATPRQAPPNAPPQHVGQQHAYQQQGVDISQQQHPATGNRPEHAVPQVMTVPGGTPSIHPGQVAGPQLVKHQGPQQPVMVAHHSHQIPPSPITQQIPVASPGIQHFATPSQHAPMQGQPIIAGRMPIDKNNMPAMQKTITSPKAENAYPPAPNIHIAVSQVPQTMPSAVYSVSAANPSPVASSHYQPPVTLTAVSALKNQGQSPVVASQVSSPLVPSMESSAKTAPVDVDLSEQGGKQLNPEAVEFKPRSSTKIATAVVAARTNTPVPQQQQFIPQGQMLTQMPQLVAPGQMYPGQLAPIDPMNPPMQMMQMIPPPYFPQMVAGQQMPQYLEQMYQAHNTQQMIPANARVAAMQSNPPQHMSQFTPDQAQPQMYVPMQQQPYMTQARPHSAHTPTQVSHVTATSPASQTIQQPPQAVNHPPSMVQAPHPTGQQPIYFVPHQHMGPQPPVQTQYITTVPSAVMPSSVAMTNVTPQQKGQHQQVAYVAQASARQYAPYSAAPST